MAAKEELLGMLHEIVANDLIAKIKSGEATAQELNAAIKFLKDNGIEAAVEDNDPLQRLSEALPEFNREDGLYGRKH